MILQAETRGLAVQCLLLLTKLPFATLAPYRESVLIGLKSALDDKKRQVRKAAVKCRNEWFVLK